MKFNHLYVPETWQHYWSKYPEGYTILEALLNWVAQVDSMVDNQNTLTDTVTAFRQELDTFVQQFGPELEQQVIATLEEWQTSGFLGTVIDAALNTQLQDVRLELADKIGGPIKAEPENLSERTLALVTGTGTVNLLSDPQIGSVTHEKTSFLTTGKNLFDKAKAVNGYYVAGSTGVLMPSELPFTTSGFIPVQPNTTYTRRQSNYIAFYRADKTHISGNSASGLTFTTPAECYYIRISMSTSIVDIEQVEVGAATTPYEAFYQQFRQDVRIPFVDTFSDKSILYMGDSITKMVNGWVSKMIALLNPKSTINVAVDGATWRDKANTPAYDGNPVLGGDNALNVLGNQVQKVLNNNYPAPDAIIISAGTNDEPPETTDLESQFTSEGTYIPLNDVDRTTFAGSIRWCVEVLQNKYPNTQIFIVTPIQRAEDSRPHTVTEAKAERIHAVASRLSLPVFDAYHRSGIYGKYEAQGAKGKYLEDGLHPIPTNGVSAVAGSKPGSTKLGEYITQEFKTKFVRS